MKNILTFLLSIIMATSAYGQVITYDDFKTVIPYLQKENFKDAFDLTSKLLNSTQNDSSDLRGIVTYMNIYAAAGMVSLDQMSYNDFEKNTQKYVGQYIVMPAHPCIDSSKHGFNSLQFVTKGDSKLYGLTIASNSAETNILLFEYFDYTELINPADLRGKNVRCGGILQTFETNPNKSKIWIARLHISNAFARATAQR